MTSIDLGSVSVMTHSETDFGSVEDGMIYPRSFLLLHSSSRAGPAVQGSAFYGWDSSDG